MACVRCLCVQLCNGDPYLRTAAAGDNRAISLDVAALIAHATEQFQRRQMGDVGHPAAPPSRASTDLAGRDSVTDTESVGGPVPPAPAPMRPGKTLLHRVCRPNR